MQLTINGKRTPIELTGLGYASFCKRNPQVNTGDFIVVEYQEEYSTNFVSTGVTMVFLSVVSFLGAPLLVHFLYNHLYEPIKSNSYYMQFLTWAVVMVLIAADYAFIDHFLHALPHFWVGTN